MVRTLDNIRPLNDYIVIARDEYPKAVGSILLTEELPMAANIAYYSGRVLKIGPRVLSLLGLTSEDQIIGKRVAFRRYLSEIVTLREKWEGKEVFFLHAAKDDKYGTSEVEIILDEDTKVNLL
jgi:co-chaperonin GroES (HSP10)